MATFVAILGMALSSGGFAATTGVATDTPPPAPTIAFTFQGRIAQTTLSRYGCTTPMLSKGEPLDGPESFHVNSAPQGVMWGTRDDQYACQYIDACFHQSLSQLEWALSPTPSLSRMTHISGRTDQFAWDGVGINVTEIRADTDEADLAFWGRIRYSRLIYAFSIDPVGAFKEYFVRDRRCEVQETQTAQRERKHVIRNRFVDRDNGAAGFLVAEFLAEPSPGMLPACWRLVMCDLDSGMCYVWSFALCQVEPGTFELPDDPPALLSIYDDVDRIESFVFQDYTWSPHWPEYASIMFPAPTVDRK